MEFFPDRAFVRLRSRVRGTFMYADEDGTGVSLSTRRESLNAAWLVHRIVRQGVACVLLHSAAYSRYLAASDDQAPFGHYGRRAVLNYYGDPLQEDVAWVAEWVGDHVVRLRHVSNRFLRANGRYIPWHNGVSIDNALYLSRMMNWKVEHIPPRLVPPVLPYAPPFRGVFLRPIAYAQAQSFEAFNPDAIRTFMFVGRSVSQLRYEVAIRLHEPNYLAITLCVRAGYSGRWIPLVSNLPRAEYTIFLIVLPTASPAALSLRHPNVDAQ